MKNSINCCIKSSLLQVYCRSHDMTSGCVVVTRVLYLVPCIHGDIPFNKIILQLWIELLEQEHKRIILLCTFVKVHKQFFGILLLCQSINMKFYETVIFESHSTEMITYCSLHSHTTRYCYR